MQVLTAFMKKIGRQMHWTDGMVLANQYTETNDSVFSVFKNTRNSLLCFSHTDFGVFRNNWCLT